MNNCYKCQQYWDSKWINNGQACEGEALMYVKTRDYIGIDKDIEISFNSLKDPPAIKHITQSSSQNPLCPKMKFKFNDSNTSS